MQQYTKEEINFLKKLFRRSRAWCMAGTVNPCLVWFDPRVRSQILFHLSILGEYPRLLTERGWFEPNRWSQFKRMHTANINKIQFKNET